MSLFSKIKNAFSFSNLNNWSPSSLKAIDNAVGDFSSLSGAYKTNDDGYAPNSLQNLQRAQIDVSPALTSASKVDQALEKGLSSEEVQNFINQWQTSAAKVAQDYARTANEYNAQQAELAFQRSQSSAEKQMQFQREMFDKETAYNTLMSNTQYQRAVADLKKAGINPILAVGGLSGSVPSASSYSGASASASAPTAYNSDVVSGMNADRSPMGALAMLLTSAAKIIEAFGEQ